ncbi:MAG: Threonyl-tRNA synthetase [Microgenomates group bacterium GW2011_GWC1_39_12]|nr:MAG: Threonyl-tRNA synthetase [Microgenomates group bacterium GW2011_GWC1_39_12]
MSKILEEKLEKMSKGEQELWALRHTAEHVLHTALQNLYPSMKKAMGPATDDGFYHDFDLGDKVSEEDFPKIEKEMQRIIDLNLPMVQRFVTAKEAHSIFKNNLYKLEWVSDIEKRGEKFSLFSIGNIDTDLCSGPHAKSTGVVKAFKLLSVAGAYWHGDEKNKMLTRVYGTAFKLKKELDDYLTLIEEAKKRDHRKLGKDLGLFVFSDLVGKGLPMLTAKGATIRRELERFIVDEEIKRGYQHVITPSLAKVDLYKTSGHYPYYKNTMYPPMIVDDEKLILRPMTCPHHFMLYKSEPHSYRELPIRLAELSPQFRYEKSGELTGLMRVRMFCLADAHIISQTENAKEEIKKVLELIDFVNSTLGMVKGKDYRYRLSLGDRKDTKKYFKDDVSWDNAEQVLREVLVDIKAPFFEAPNEAAFYGPKIDIQIKNISGHEETAFTVQYDFVMPKRFQLTYIDTDGKEKEPVVIHRSSLGAFERTMAFLIEKYAGALPLWLSPVQISIIPIGERHVKAAQKVMEEMKTAGIRVELNEKNEPMGAKIREATLQKIPYMAIIGDREIADNSVSVRTRSGEDLKAIKLSDFINRLSKDIEHKL